MKATRQDMLRYIEAQIRYPRQLIGRDALDARVMQAMKEVPREKGELAHYLRDQHGIEIEQTLLEDVLAISLD